MSEHDQVPVFDADVRLPSHIQPPFRAQQFMGTMPNRWDLAGADGPHIFHFVWSNCAPMFRDKDEPAAGPDFPAGMLGELHFAWVSAISGLVVPEGRVIWSLLKNGNPVQGFCRRTPWYEHFIQAGATPVRKLEIAPVLVPIHLQEGDRLDFLVQRISGADSWAGQAEFAGWMYGEQIAGDAGSIRQTGQDPRTRRPLGR